MAGDQQGLYRVGFMGTPPSAAVVTGPGLGEGVLVGMADRAHRWCKHLDAAYHAGVLAGAEGMRERAAGKAQEWGADLSAVEKHVLKGEEMGLVMAIRALPLTKEDA